MFSAVLAFAIAAALPAERAEYLFSQMLANGIPREHARTLLEDSRLEVFPPRVVGPRTIDWDQIIAGLVAPSSVRNGVEFAERYRQTLADVEKQFRVDQDVIVAILRMESNFGRNTGSYVVFNVFYTLMIQREEERRWKFAADNLAALAAYCQASRSDCFSVKGSYGGALGAAQFLPFSVLQFGADGNSDRVINPFLMEDAIHSAANFLVKHGWHEDSTAALGKYYGSSVGYPGAVLAYAAALKKLSGKKAPAAAAQATTQPLPPQ